MDEARRKRAEDFLSTWDDSGLHITAATLAERFGGEREQYIPYLQAVVAHALADIIGHVTEGFAAAEAFPVRMVADAIVTAQIAHNRKSVQELKDVAEILSERLGIDWSTRPAAKEQMDATVPQQAATNNS